MGPGVGRARRTGEAHLVGQRSLCVCWGGGVPALRAPGTCRGGDREGTPGEWLQAPPPPPTGPERAGRPSPPRLSGSWRPGTGSRMQMSGHNPARTSAGLLPKPAPGRGASGAGQGAAPGAAPAPRVPEARRAPLPAARAERAAPPDSPGSHQGRAGSRGARGHRAIAPLPGDPTRQPQATWAQGPTPQRSPGSHGRAAPPSPPRPPVPVRPGSGLRARPTALWSDSRRQAQTRGRAARPDSPEAKVSRHLERRAGPWRRAGPCVSATGASPGTLPGVGCHPLPPPACTLGRGSPPRDGGRGAGPSSPAAWARDPAGKVTPVAGVGRSQPETHGQGEGARKRRLPPSRPRPPSLADVPSRRVPSRRVRSGHQDAWMELLSSGGAGGLAPPQHTHKCSLCSCGWPPRLGPQAAGNGPAPASTTAYLCGKVA